MCKPGVRARLTYYVKKQASVRRMWATGKGLLRLSRLGSLVHIR